MAKTGIVKLLAQKYNVDTREVKRAIMLSAVKTYRRILQELGLEKGNAKVYRTVLKHALPIAWEMAREQQKLPTPEEVYQRMIAAWPNYREELRALLVKA